MHGRYKIYFAMLTLLAGISLRTGTSSAKMEGNPCKGRGGLVKKPLFWRR